jgi:hypothetical protein
MSFQIISGRDVKDPESIYLEFHNLDSQPNYTEESKIRFLVKISIITFIILFLRITFESIIPKIIDVFLALILTICVVLFSFTLVNVINGMIADKGLKGFILFICIVGIIAALGGVFL